MSPSIPTTRMFIVHVSHDTERNVWVAVCDVIGLATEAETYEGLTKRVCEIIPEIARENGIDTNIETINVRFHPDQATQ